jgi:hypothetical protein
MAIAANYNFIESAAKVIPRRDQWAREGLVCGGISDRELIKCASIGATRCRISDGSSCRFDHAM